MREAGHLWLMASSQVQQGLHYCFQSLEGGEGRLYITSPPTSPSRVCTSLVQAMSLEAPALPAMPGSPQHPPFTGALGPLCPLWHGCGLPAQRAGCPGQLCRERRRPWEAEAPGVLPTEADEGRRTLLFAHHLLLQMSFCHKLPLHPFFKKLWSNCLNTGLGGKARRSETSWTRPSLSRHQLLG